MHPASAAFYAWTREQADALRRRAGSEIDWDGIAEELEDMGRSDKRTLALCGSASYSHAQGQSDQPR